MKHHRILGGLSFRVLKGGAIAFGWWILQCSMIAAPAGAGLLMSLNPETSQLLITFRGHKVLDYSYRPDQYKPYVKGLYPLGGDNVLRDSPPGHPHHHGLMYAIWVNGINFWEEHADSGYERGGTPVIHRLTPSPKGFPRASFSQKIDWIPPRAKGLPNPGAAAFLVEDRTLTLTVDPTGREVAIRWDASFTPGPKVSEVTLSGNDYNGLGLRLPKAFDEVAVQENSVGRPDLRHGRQDVSRAKWSAVYLPGSDPGPMVVLMGRPSNRRGDTAFFTMVHPFTYLSATQGLDKKPLKYHAGERFRLCYLVLVYPDVKSKAFLDRRYQEWIHQ